MTNSPETEIDTILRLAQSATRREIVRNMQKFANSYGFEYLQLWMADEEDAERAILLITEVGNNVQSVAEDLYRLLPNQGLAGTCWALQTERELDATDPEQLSRVALPEFVKVENLYTLVALPLNAAAHRGVVLVGSRGKTHEATAEFKRSLSSVACLALDRYSELQVLGAGEAAQFVVSSVSNETDERDIMVEVLSRCARAVTFDWAVFVRWNGARSQLPALCSHPAGHGGTSRTHTALIETILRAETPFRAYRVGAPDQFATNATECTPGDLAGLLDGAPADVLTGGHCMAVPVRLQDASPDFAESPSPTNIFGIVVFGRISAQPGFTHVDGQLTMSIFQSLAAVLTCIRRSRTGMAMLDSAATVLAEPKLEGIRTKIAKHLADNLQATQVSYVSVVDLTSSVAAGRDAATAIESTASQVLNGAEFAQSPDAQHQFRMCDAGRVEVLGAVIRMDRLLGAIRLEVDDELDPSSPEASLVLLLADHLALAESEQVYFDVALDSHLASKSLKAAVSACDAGVQVLLGQVERLAQAGTAQVSGARVAVLRGEAMRELSLMRTRVGLLSQAAGHPDASAPIHLDELDLDEVTDLAASVLPEHAVSFSTAPGARGPRRPVSPSPVDTLRMLITLLSVAVGEAPDQQIDVQLGFGGSGIVGTFDITARWVPAASSASPSESVVASIALGRTADQMNARLDRYVDADGATVIGLGRNERVAR